MEVLRLVPVGAHGAVELVLCSTLPSLGHSLGRFLGANAPDIDLSVEVVAQVRPSVCCNHHNLRKVIFVLHVRRSGDIFTREGLNLLVPRNGNGWAQTVDVSLIEEVVGCLIHELCPFTALPIVQRKCIAQGLLRRR